jgi:hypothetical protein
VLLDTDDAKQGAAYVLPGLPVLDVDSAVVLDTRRDGRCVVPEEHRKPLTARCLVEWPPATDAARPSLVGRLALLVPPEGEP